MAQYGAKLTGPTGHELQSDHIDFLDNMKDHIQELVKEAAHGPVDGDDTAHGPVARRRMITSA